MFGYTVKISGIGKPLEPDPYAAERDTADLGAATQVAVFTRKSSGHSAPLSPPLTPPDAAHSLCLEVLFNSRPTPSAVGGTTNIQAAVREHFVHNNEGSCTLHSLWYHSTVATLCAGNFGHLLDVLEDLLIQDESWSVACLAGGSVTFDTEVTWGAFIATPAADRTHGTDGWGKGSVWSPPTSPALSDSSFIEDGEEQDGSADLVRADTVPDLQQEASDSAIGWVSLPTDNWAWEGVGTQHHDWGTASPAGWSSG